MAEATPTGAERLDAILRKLAPNAAAYHVKTAATNAAADPPSSPDWPKRQVGGRMVACAPYEFDTLADGRRRLRVFDDDGDLAMKGVGATIVDAIADLERRLQEAGR